MCAPHYSGTNCQQYDYCGSSANGNPCANGGNCTNTLDGAKCSCSQASRSGCACCNASPLTKTPSTLATGCSIQVLYGNSFQCCGSAASATCIGSSASSANTTNDGASIGAAIGAIAGIALIVLIVLLIRRQRAKNQERSQKNVSGLDIAGPQSRDTPSNLIDVNGGGSGVFPDDPKERDYKRVIGYDYLRNENEMLMITDNEIKGIYREIGLVHSIPQDMALTKLRSNTSRLVHHKLNSRSSSVVLDRALDFLDLPLADLLLEEAIDAATRLACGESERDVYEDYYDDIANGYEDPAIFHRRTSALYASLHGLTRDDSTRSDTYDFASKETPYDRAVPGLSREQTYARANGTGEPTYDQAQAQLQREPTYQFATTGGSTVKKTVKPGQKQPTEPSYEFATAGGASVKKPNVEPSYEFATAGGASVKKPSAEPSYEFATSGGNQAEPAYEFAAAGGASVKKPLKPSNKQVGEPSYEFATSGGNHAEPSYEFAANGGNEVESSYEFASAGGASVKKPAKAMKNQAGEPSYEFASSSGNQAESSYEFASATEHLKKAGSKGESESSYEFASAGGNVSEPSYEFAQAQAEGTYSFASGSSVKHPSSKGESNYTLASGGRPEGNYTLASGSSREESSYALASNSIHEEGKF